MPAVARRSFDAARPSRRVRRPLAARRRTRPSDTAALAISVSPAPRRRRGRGRGSESAWPAAPARRPAPPYAASRAPGTARNVPCRRQAACRPAAGRPRPPARAARSPAGRTSPRSAGCRRTPAPVRRACSFMAASAAARRRRRCPSTDPFEPHQPASAGEHRRSGRLPTRGVERQGHGAIGARVGRSIERRPCRGATGRAAGGMAIACAGDVGRDSTRSRSPSARPAAAPRRARRGASDRA